MPIFVSVIIHIRGKIKENELKHTVSLLCTFFVFETSNSLPIVFKL